MSNASLAETDQILETTILFARIWCFSMLSFGSVGHLLSIFTFTRPTLRSNPCSRYFLASTISGCAVLVINIPLRLLQAGYKINVLTNSLLICRLVTMLLMWTRAQFAWFMALASFDRFLCSSSSTILRSWSNIRLASRLICIAIPLVGLAFIHVTIYFQINVRQATCVPMFGFYQTFFGVWNLIAFSFVPPLLMLIFALSTARNIRQSVHRIGPMNIQQRFQIHHQQRRKLADRQLIQMMFGQCFIFILTASLPSVQFIYTSVRSTIPIDALQSAKDNLFYNLAGFLSLTVPCMSFYLFTLSSRLFRAELMRIFRQSWPQITTTSLSKQNKS